MGFIRDNTNTFQVCLTDLGKQKFFDGGFKDAISFFSISDGDSNYDIFNPSLNEIIPFNDKAVINIGDVVRFDSYAPINNNSIYNIIDTTTDNFEINAGFGGSGGFAGFDYPFSIAVQPDGKILAGGGFTFYSGTTSNGIIRLNSNGTIDNTFNIGTGFTNTVLSIAVQPDGKILAGGDFTSYSGVTSNYIIRLNTGGTIDNTFTIGGGFNNSVDSIVLQPDGKILAGGSFASYGGFLRNRIIRLNSNGTIDNTFNIGTGLTNGFDGPVSTIALQPDGKILVGGAFTSYSGVTSNYIIRLNTGGTIDNTFNIGSGFDNGVKTIVLQPDGKILVGGGFTSYSGVTSNRIIRLNTGGTIDNTFNIGSGFDNAVYSIALQPDGKILAGGGFFTLYDGVVCNGIIRLNSDATINATFNTGTGFTPPTYINTITLQPDGKILAGGLFTSYNNTNMAGLIRLNIDGSVDKIEDIVTRYFRNTKEFFNKNQPPFFNSLLTTNSEYWEETFPFDSTNINPQPIQILNHNGVKKTSLPLNISNENTYDINRTITITSLSDYNSMLNGTILVGDSGNNGRNQETIHLKYNELVGGALRKSVIIASEGTKIYGDYKLGIIGNGSKIGVDIYIDISEKQIILDEGVFNCIIIKPYYENTWKNDPENLSPANNHVSYITGGTTGSTAQLRFNFGVVARPTYPQEFKAFEVLDDYIALIGDGIINITTPSGITTSFSIEKSDNPNIVVSPPFDQMRFFPLNAPYPPQLSAVSGDTLVVNFDYFISDFTLVQNSATDTFKIESNIQINAINDIFVQTTLRGDIVDNKTYRYALFGVKNKTQKSYVLFEPDFNSNDTLSILTYLINE